MYRLEPPPSPNLLCNSFPGPIFGPSWENLDEWNYGSSDSSCRQALTIHPSRFVTSPMFLEGYICLTQHKWWKKNALKKITHTSPNASFVALPILKMGSSLPICLCLSAWQTRSKILEHENGIKLSSSISNTQTHTLTRQWKSYGCCGLSVNNKILRICCLRSSLRFETTVPFCERNGNRTSFTGSDKNNGSRIFVTVSKPQLGQEGL